MNKNILALLLLIYLCPTIVCMDKNNKDSQNCWGWLTTKKRKQKYQAVPAYEQKPTAPLTSIEKYRHLTVKRTKILIEKQCFGEMADLIEAVHLAKTQDNISPYNLGKYIFNTTPLQELDILASLMVCRIGLYLTKQESENKPHLTKTMLNLNEMGEQDIEKNTINRTQLVASYIINTFILKDDNKKLAYNESYLLGWDLSEIILHKEHAGNAAQQLYADNESNKKKKMKESI